MIFAIRDSAQYVLTTHAPQPYAPLLMTEHVRSLEPHVDFALAEATDFLRGDVGYDGITGVMKLAHAAESLGLDIEFHGPGPAQRQCMAAVRNTNYYEMGLVHPHAPQSDVAFQAEECDGWFTERSTVYTMNHFVPGWRRQPQACRVQELSRRTWYEMPKPFQQFVLLLCTPPAL